jgi:hypothetical protein
MPALLALAAAGPHVRTGPELSDAALFVLAAVAVWWLRRRLRARRPRD